MAMSHGTRGTAAPAPSPPPRRLGFAVKVMGTPGLRSNDARRWQSGPHLRTSIAYLREIFAYLDRIDVRMYRMSSDLAPYLTHPDLPQFHRQLDECADELEDLGRLARSLDLRLSFHPSQYVVLNSPDEALNARGAADVDWQAELLDRMGLGPEAVVVVHVGGAYGDKLAGGDRWARTYRALPEHARRRLVLENDDVRYSALDVLRIHENCGVPLIFDHQHYWCNNPEGLGLREAVSRFLRTWPAGARPKLHFSSPRTELREVARKNRSTGKPETTLIPPIWTGHADFVHPFEFIQFLRLVADLEPPFDVMLEAKAKDLALVRLRRDLARYAPDLAPLFGLDADADAVADPDEETADSGPTKAE
ncbi:UV DNA damage repair endonuclease UvsE [Tautonia plasticadhaerens]|uniref:UV DNA damage endonuclease n=1 Tax=Tautonia plasticadhaerens TaxID=2527974 RepID=A0A518HDF1_9BACT|nr:UV DNA damage repair endonuclease UvsE [Tautonia plasticadhaerens]QDV38891.1 UV DNA damage endonuclease [Tautonia plasticadhaerens]